GAMGRATRAGRGGDSRRAAPRHGRLRHPRRLRRRLPFERHPAGAVSRVGDPGPEQQPPDRPARAVRLDHRRGRFRRERRAVGVRARHGGPPHSRRRPGGLRRLPRPVHGGARPSPAARHRRGARIRAPRHHARSGAGAVHECTVRLAAGQGPGRRRLRAHVRHRRPRYRRRARRAHLAALGAPRRGVPAVEDLLAERDIAAVLATHPRSLVLRAVREAIDAARADGGTVPLEGWGAAVRARAYRLAAPSLGPVINATGVVLHTNLGRAPLAATAIAALRRVAGEYANLEYDLARGTRGSRHGLCRGLLTELTGAADALVVNNAAGALLLALSALARDGEAIVSRGELVEIGGAFRIPDIMARSGAKLVEVGATNRTHRKDYEGAIGPASRLLLKVHRSNFQLTGFTADVPPQEIVAV